MPRWAFSLVSLVVLISAGAILGSGAGCASATRHHPGGSLAGDDAGGDDGGIVTPPPTALGVSVFTSPCASGSPTVDWSPVRRVSRVEYNNMVRDLLGDTTQPATSFAPESPMTYGVNFLNNTYSSASSLIAQQYIQGAEALAYAAVTCTTLPCASNTVALNTTLGCTTQDDACAQTFISSFANRAFRGQLDTTESMGLLNLYSSVKTQFDFPTGIQAVIEAVLESPRFLYVIELGDGMPNGSVTPLSQYEIAGRLAFFLWRSVPDATLMQAASANQLSTPTQIQTQATRMLADTRAQGALNDFTTQWAQLQGTATAGKDSQFKLWNANSKLGEELADETLTNVSQLILAANGDLTTLLTSPMSYINSDLASFYGGGTATALTVGSSTVVVNDPSLSQTTFGQTMIPNRMGILTNGSIMATQAHSSLPSAVLRGKIVRENVLCDVITHPPANVPRLRAWLPTSTGARRRRASSWTRTR